ncbi:glutamate 5-kinase [Erythrobacter sp. LQ02-29]|uniref:glutamate 5-kinase n=1 Tax=Erythrobacter sp. LQ02-29 TaxID=2920384 RepID=UPI001F4D5625|nr:glutamate 5-kinase [Erythrobacter sp. LQ02-29]MCP9222546.1 glutamate 5-kinase [Erythrobacter sp. LQ02-29]
MAIATLEDLRRVRRVVLKIGSALLVERGEPRAAWLRALAGEIAAMRKSGQQVVVVSSGAIALGAAQFGLERGGRATLADAQAAASRGQLALARLWDAALDAHGLAAAQMLVTLGDLEDRRRYLNASATLERLLELGAVPVVNENDSVATEEIRFGDNDRLAARVAQAAGADAVLLLSDVDGLYDRDPREAGATRLSVVETIDETIRAMASDRSGSGLGSGGMQAKIAAAQIATRAGIALAIGNGREGAPIARALDDGIGTLFLPGEGAAARKGWLGGRIAPAGTLTVDEGCARALTTSASLLAAGIVAVEGDFGRGDLVRVARASGRAIAQGLVEYDAAACRAIMGLRAEDQSTALGHAPRSAVIHRDHLVLL